MKKRLVAAPLLLVVVGLALIGWSQTAEAGEPELGCNFGTLVGTECEADFGEPELVAPCPAATNGVNDIRYIAIEDVCFETYFKTPAETCIDAFVEPASNRCVLKVEPLEPAVLGCSNELQEIVAGRCIARFPALCTRVIIEVWFDDNADGVRQASETTASGVPVRLFEATASGQPGAEVPIADDFCVMSGSYIFQVVSDSITIRDAATSGVYSQVDQASGLSDVLTVGPVEAATVWAGVVPAVQPEPITVAFLPSVFSCEQGVMIEVGGGTPPYGMFFTIQVRNSPLPTFEPFFGNSITEPGLFMSGPPFGRSYEAGRSYPITLRVGDATGRSAEIESSFVLTEPCTPGPTPAVEPTPTPDPTPAPEPTTELPTVVPEPTAPAIVEADALAYEGPFTAQPAVDRGVLGFGGSPVIEASAPQLTPSPVAALPSGAIADTGAAALAHTGSSPGLLAVGFTLLGTGALTIAHGRRRLIR